MNKAQINDSFSSLIKNEKKTRRINWLAGPLAPNQDIGKGKGQYGTVEDVAFRPIELPRVARAGPKVTGYQDIDWLDPEEVERKGFKGRTIIGNVIRGDHVVIVSGNETLKGVVGLVKEVDESAETIVLEEINMVCLCNQILTSAR